MDRLRAMSLLLAAAVFAASLFASARPGMKAAYLSPSSALDFEAIDLNGEPYFASEKLRGQVVLLDFWASWCGPCVKAIPRLNQLREEFKARGFEVVGLASYSGTLEDVRRFLEKRDARYPIVLADDDILEQFSVVGYPTYFLVDRQGQIVQTYVGEIESQLDRVRASIRDLLASRASEHR